jgi:hypothetical protein
MAGDKVLVIHVSIFRYNSLADTLGIAASRVKGTTGGWVHRTGHIPLKRDAFGLKIRVRHGYRRHERFGIRMFGI